ncbi:hypothetical protein MH215_28385 [Paenibacillus sp. ACRSA]|uniref:hypothetical protein n=1 Tax=Paenibacillus sp. ACRSA TaxID=2918211 RepID=UPI001EF59D49|nr:hypothetical protein [Paenibacillus sp. ACRSA]MCG7380904.1 hypothetical protein [Paenibacillus sp. ACRSA]
MKKRMGALLLTMLLTVSMALTACGTKQEPKEALKTAASNASKLTSYEMSSNFTINDLSYKPGAESQGDPTMTQFMSMLKDAQLNVTGVYQSEPMQTEMTLGIELKGDMGMTFNIPMVMTAEKLYVKVPNVPFFPIPETIVNKFVEIDLKELAEQEGTEFNPQAMDAAKTQKLSNEVMDAVLGEYDQEKFFKNIAVKDAALPEEVDAKQVVQFSVTNDNVKEAVTVLVTKALPKVMDIVSKEEYREMLQLSQEDIDRAKEDLNITEADQAEMSKDLDKLKETLTINKFNIDFALDKQDFPVYQKMDADLLIKQPDTKDEVKLAFTGSNTYTKINEKPAFKINIPTGDNVITMQELEELMNSSYGY